MTVSQGNLRQAGQDSNLEPADLESAALPVELPACESDYPGNLLGFPVQSMFTASRTIFPKLQTVRIVVPILLRCVIALFALCACQRDYYPDLFRHSCLGPMQRWRTTGSSRAGPL